MAKLELLQGLISSDEIDIFVNFIMKSNDEDLLYRAGVPFSKLFEIMGAENDRNELNRIF